MNTSRNRGTFKGCTDKTASLQKFIDALREYQGMRPLYRDPLLPEEQRFYARPVNDHLPAVPKRVPTHTF